MRRPGLPHAARGCGQHCYRCLVRANARLPARGQDDARHAGLLVYLGRVPDRRRVRGRGRQLTAILALACGAVTAGAKSLTAIAQWAAAAPAAVLAAFGVPAGPAGRHVGGAVGDHDPPDSLAASTRTRWMPRSAHGCWPWPGTARTRMPPGTRW